MLHKAAQQAGPSGQPRGREGRPKTGAWPPKTRPGREPGSAAHEGRTVMRNILFLEAKKLPVLILPFLEDKKLPVLIRPWLRA